MTTSILDPTTRDIIVKGELKSVLSSEPLESAEGLLRTTVEFDGVPELSDGSPALSHKVSFITFGKPIVETA